MNSSASKEKNYITPYGFQLLRSELDHLVKTERPEVTKVVAWAAGNGDRSENADYQYGKKRLREIDRRIRFLTARIEAAVVVDPTKPVKRDRVQFGAKVIVSNDEGEEKTFTIVGVDEINTEKGYISWKSPIGKSLLGKEDGDTVVIQVPRGLVEFEITDIYYGEIDFSK